jgi:hypothetical protein
MIQTLTIIVNSKDDGSADITLNGDLPIADAARALVIAALQVDPKQISTPG